MITLEGPRPKKEGRGEGEGCYPREGKEEHSDGFNKAKAALTLSTYPYFLSPGVRIL